MIKWAKSTVSVRPTWQTQKFGNLLSDTYQGEVHQDSDGWNGWVMNWSNNSKTIFKFRLASKQAAIRWVNNELRKMGVD